MFWWTPIIPQASAIVAARFNGEPLFTAQLEAAGLTGVTWDVPVVPLMSLEAYGDIQGPFNKVFRDGDSTWSAATEEELEADYLASLLATIIKRFNPVAGKRLDEKEQRMHPRFAPEALEKGTTCAPHDLNNFVKAGVEAVVGCRVMRNLG